MAIIPAHSAEDPFLEDTVDGSVDSKGRPASRFSTGRWRSAGFMIAAEVAERFVYYGLCSNLVTYLTGPLGQSMATAAVNLNVWDGTATLLPILGAFVADAYLGRYRTVIVSSLIYISGLGLLTLSAILTSLHYSSTLSTTGISTTSSSPPRFLVLLFMISLYIVALGQSGHKPCLQAFGADQFDGKNSKENLAKSSFFNWWYLGMSIGGIMSVLIIVYIEENVSWSFAFGILFALMVIGLVIFLLGTKSYRYSNNDNSENPFPRIGRVFVVVVRNRHFITPFTSDNEKEVQQTPSRHSSKQFKFLDKALLGPNCSEEEQNQCSIKDVEDAKALLRLIPIWTSCLVYAIVYEQASIFFVKQGSTMDRNVSPGVEIPAASFQIFVGIAIIVFIPIYDRIIIPMARVLTGEPSGITVLQRIGTGICLSVVSMVVAALVEMKRLKTAEEYRLIDNPEATVPMRAWWLVPQYLLFGLGEVFTMIGMQEFFYDQVPRELRSMGLSFYLSVLGVGSFLSSILVSVIDELSSANGGESWFTSNLNRAHLDYFYWLLAGLSMAGLGAFFHFSRSFHYNMRTGSASD